MTRCTQKQYSLLIGTQMSLQRFRAVETATDAKDTVHAILNKQGRVGAFNINFDEYFKRE